METGYPQARPEPHDPARRRVAFIGFTEGSALSARVQAMEAFMAQHFVDLKPLQVNLFPDKNGKPGRHGFVELGSPKQARIVTDHVKAQHLLVAGHAGVAIKPALTEIDRNRNWALSAAEDLIKKDQRAHGKTVSVKKAEGRGVYVNDVPAFTQRERHARGGVFVGDFSDLQLP